MYDHDLLWPQLNAVFSYTGYYHLVEYTSTKCNVHSSLVIILIDHCKTLSLSLSIFLASEECILFWDTPYAIAAAVSKETYKVYRN
jgi:hypothetical protein